VSPKTVVIDPSSEEKKLEEMSKQLNELKKAYEDQLEKINQINEKKTEMSEILSPVLQQLQSKFTVEEVQQFLSFSLLKQ
jgi:hypothetical protein